MRVAKDRLKDIRVLKVIALDSFTHYTRQITSITSTTHGDNEEIGLPAATWIAVAFVSWCEEKSHQLLCPRTPGDGTQDWESERIRTSILTCVGENA